MKPFNLFILSNQNFGRKTFKIEFKIGIVYFTEIVPPFFKQLFLF